MKTKLFIWIAVLVISASGGFYSQPVDVQADTTVYVTATGTKYHTHACGRGTYYPASLSEALSRGLTPCSKCFGGSGGYNIKSNRDGSSKKKKTTVKKIKISKKSIVLVKGQSKRLKVKYATDTIHWSSSKTSVAKVSSGGKVVAKNKGKAVITAKVGSQTQKCVVHVESPELSKRNLKLKVSQTARLKLKGCKHKIKWISEKSTIVSVKNGKIKAKKPGTATIKAIVHGKKYTCKVVVYKPVLKRVSLSKTSIQMSNDDYAYIRIKTEPGNAIKYYKISAVSSDRSIVGVYIIDEELILETYEKTGSAVITVRVGSKTVKCNVSVPEKVEKAVQIY